MENPIDHTLDLGFVNYIPHPENKSYVIFRFADTERASSFEDSLKTEKIWYEGSEDEKRGKRYLLFAIHNSDFKKAQKINYAVEAKHKKPLIPSKTLRFGLLFFSAFVLTMAVIGYIKSKNQLTESIPNLILIKE